MIRSARCNSAMLSLLLLLLVTASCQPAPTAKVEPSFNLEPILGELAASGIRAHIASMGRSARSGRHVFEAELDLTPQKDAAKVDPQKAIAPVIAALRKIGGFSEFDQGEPKHDDATGVTRGGIDFRTDNTRGTLAWSVAPDEQRKLHVLRITLVESLQSSP